MHLEPIHWFVKFLSAMSIVFEGRREAIAGVSARVADKMLHPDLGDQERHKHLFIQGEECVCIDASQHCTYTRL